MSNSPSPLPANLPSFLSPSPTHSPSPSPMLPESPSFLPAHRAFPPGHQLNPQFTAAYTLGEQLGSGGFAFVITALHISTGFEVAVKFLLKTKVPDHAWMSDDQYGRLPSEIVLLRAIEHESIVAFIDLFQDPLYFYVVQELHGTPWRRQKLLGQSPSLSPSSSLPSLSPSVSMDSFTLSEPSTPPPSYFLPQVSRSVDDKKPHLPPNAPSYFTRRCPPYDLFECIEQSENKRLSEDQARFVLKQVVEAVWYLNQHGISHRDIKDENILIDEHFKVKIIDFGSAVYEDSDEPRFYTLFYGTAAFASAECLKKQPYRAPPAEVWTLGVLLSFLLTGSSPFPTVQDAKLGNIILTDCPKEVSNAALDLLRMCLEPDPELRATIGQVRAHRWLR